MHSDSHSSIWFSLNSATAGDRGGEHDGGTTPESGTPYATPRIYNATYIGGCPGDIYSPAALLDIEVPGRTVMFTTTALSRDEGLQEYPFSEPHFAPTEDGGRAWDLQPSVHFRADGKALVAWCDGRVTLEAPGPWKDTNFYGGNNEDAGIGWFGPEEENGYWNPRSPAVLDGWTRPAAAP